MVAAGNCRSHLQISLAGALLMSSPVISCDSEHTRAGTAPPRRDSVEYAQGMLALHGATDGPAWWRAGSQPCSKRGVAPSTNQQAVSRKPDWWYGCANC